MTVQFQTDFRDLDGATAYLRRLALRTGNLRDALEEIGDALEASTQQRFLDERAPEGSAWEEHSDATKEQRGDDAEKLRLDQHLWDSLGHRVTSHEVAVGANRVYARIHQLGGEAGRKSARVTIPARPYLGISHDDERMIIETLEQHLAEANA